MRWESILNYTYNVCIKHYGIRIGDLFFNKKKSWISLENWHTDDLWIYFLYSQVSWLASNYASLNTHHIHTTQTNSNSTKVRARSRFLNYSQLMVKPILHFDFVFVFFMFIATSLWYSEYQVVHSILRDINNIIAMLFIFRMKGFC